MSNRAQSRRWTASIALLVSLAVVSAACGDSKAGNEEGGGGTGEAGDQSDITVASGDEKPIEGGRIIYALEAESDGYDPTKSRWAIAGVMVGTTVYDPLAAFDADYQIQPYLAEDFTHNDDYTEWTIQLREGVTFHNGQPLTSAEVAQVLTAHTKSLLTNFTVSFIDQEPGPDGEEGTGDDIAAITTPDPLTVVVKMEQPWATFPSILAGQVGVVPYPTVYDGTNPDGPSEPIGTGPFEQESWTPDSSWKGKKFDDYWQEDLPYLDEIEYRPVTDTESRGSALKSGDIQMFHTTEPSQIQEFRQLAADGEVQLVEDAGEGEETMVLLNTSKPPFDNENARLALAYATDKTTYIETIAPGTEPSNGPFAPDSRWYDPAVEEEYPQFDLDKAKEAVEAYEEDTGGPLVVVLGNTTSTSSRQQSNLLSEMWTAAGIEVETTSTEQAPYINTAISGDFEANAWRQFGEPDPDNGFHWWSGASNLNFSRNKDATVDEALLAGRATEDVEARKEQYSIVQRQFAVDLPYIWIYHTRWVVAATLNVRGITNGPLPDGTPSLPMGSGYSGTHRVAYLWLAGS